jgi:hypothetical protein
MWVRSGGFFHDDDPPETPPHILMAILLVVGSTIFVIGRPAKGKAAIMQVFEERYQG